MSDDLHDEIDALAIRVERQIEKNKQTLENAPDFEYGAWVREQEQRAIKFFSNMNGVVP